MLLEIYLSELVSQGIMLECDCPETDPNEMIQAFTHEFSVPLFFSDLNQFYSVSKNKITRITDKFHELPEGWNSLESCIITEKSGDSRDFDLRAPLKTEHFWTNQGLKALLLRGEFAAFLSF
jgi:hypothetical protein